MQLMANIKQNKVVIILNCMEKKDHQAHSSEAAQT